MKYTHSSRIEASRLVASAVSVVPALIAGAAAAVPPAIEVLSNRADLISGGDALVELIVPPGTGVADVSVDVGGRDVSSAFALRPNGRWMGVVDGLPLGESLITLRLPDGSRDRSPRHQ